MIAEQPPQSLDPNIRPADISIQAIQNLAPGLNPNAIADTPPSIESDESFMVRGLDMPDPAPTAAPQEAPSAWSRLGAAFESLTQDPAVRRVGRAALIGAGVELGVVKENAEGGIRASKMGIAKAAATLVLTRGMALRPMALQAVTGARERGGRQFKQELRDEMRRAA